MPRRLHATIDSWDCGCTQLRARCRSSATGVPCKRLFFPCERGGGLQNSTLQAGKVSSCMATVLLLPSTVIINSPNRSWASWYQSCIGRESKVGMRVTCRRSRHSSQQVSRSTIIHLVATHPNLRPAGLPFQESIQDAPHGRCLDVVVSTDDVM